MKYFLAFCLLVAQGFASVAFAAQGDYEPVRRGITVSDYPYGTDESPSFNGFVDGALLASLRRQTDESDYMDERDFVVARKVLSDSDLDDAEVYQHTVSGLEMGDRVAVQVYLHNNAMQRCGGGGYYPAEDTEVGVDWSDSSSLKATVSSSTTVYPEIVC